MSEALTQDPNKPTQQQWSNVDATADAQAITRYLDTIRAMNGTEAYKRRSLEMLSLGPGLRILDAGCGTGDDALALSRQVSPGGEVWGLDFSAALIAESQKRWQEPGLHFTTGDIHALSFPSHHFDGARADRVFQHLASPRQALSELVRVTRPGGRVVISDPDWGTYVIDGPDSPSLRTYLTFAQGQAKNAWIGRQLYGLFREAGLTQLELAVHTVIFLDYTQLERLGNLDAGFVTAMQAGLLTEPEVTALKAAFLARHQEGRFLASVSVFTVGGTCPAP